MKKLKKSWVVIDGRLKKIAYKGENDFRFPQEIVELVIQTYSKKGDWILDPFAGFGTTLHVAQKLGRKAVGFEVHTGRATFASKGLKAPSRIINARAETIQPKNFPKFNLVFTSPPYSTVRLKDDPNGKTYFQDIERIFSRVSKTLHKDAMVVVEVSNLRKKEGVRQLAWQIGTMLMKIFAFQGEIICCNNNSGKGGPGYDHGYLLIYKKK